MTSSAKDKLAEATNNSIDYLATNEAAGAIPDETLFNDVVAANKAAQERIITLPPNERITPPGMFYEFALNEPVTVHFLDNENKEKAYAGELIPAHYFLVVGKHKGEVDIDDDSGNTLLNANVLRLTIKPSDIDKLPDNNELPLNLMPIAVKDLPDTPLTYGDLLSWLTYDELQKILKAKAEDNQLEQTSKEKLNMTGAIVRNNLTALTWNFDKSFIQILEGYETIAKNSKATVIIAKDFDGNEMQLAANTDEAKYYFDLGGDRYFLGKVLQVVTSLVKQANTADFKTDGRVWFTVNKIAAEVTRTSAGVAEIRKRPDWITLTDAALVLLTGSRLKGTNSAFVGGTQNLDYIANGIRRESVIVNGIEYRAVWGFEDKGENSYNSYKAVEAHSFEYPLLDAVKPLTPTQSSYETVLRRALHQCRKKLYYETVKNAQKKHRDVYQLSLPYDDIFNAFGASSSRQKLAVVRGLEAVLKALAEDEAAGKVDEKRPLHIVAYSRRDAAKGRGAGKWVALVIEAHRFHTVKTPHVDLQTSKEKKTS